ncbi:hypothetical protein K438DRAFT_1754816 [Mycena galopus ATCC 62051]|nr:hypothetical protein K438DRAFT_1754816 [Mycena galopus ATCC 62051]
MPPGPAKPSAWSEEDEELWPTKKLSAKLFENLQSEIQILKSLSYRHITKLIDMVRMDHNIYLIMETSSRDKERLTPPTEKVRRPSNPSSTKPVTDTWIKRTKLCLLRCRARMAMNDRDRLNDVRGDHNFADVARIPAPWDVKPANGTAAAPAP